MENGFNFEMYGEVFENCFIHTSNYSNGDLQVSLFGTDPKTNQTAHFLDISLEQNDRVLKPNEIVVDCQYKPDLIPQLIELGILERQTGIYVFNHSIYPVYTVNMTKIYEEQYCMQSQVA